MLPKLCADFARDLKPEDGCEDAWLHLLRCKRSVFLRESGSSFRSQSLQGRQSSSNPSHRDPHSCKIIKEEKKNVQPSWETAKDRADGQRRRKRSTLHFEHIQLCKPCSGNNNYDLKRPYFCINLKGCIFFLPSSLRGFTYPKYLHKSTVTVNMYSTIQSSISYQVRVKTGGNVCLVKRLSHESCYHHPPLKHRRELHVRR